ncbi:MAG: hypothetical protein QOI78_8008 [Actinomycetota bacterium]|nr:hypothetical protein [Actinomycetota bacterium]
MAKVGGFPAYLYSGVPECATCNRPMLFVAQIPPLNDVLSMGGGDSDTYLFVCPDEHAAAFKM